VVIKHRNQFLMEFTHHPVCAAKDASQHFLYRADTPPRRGGECQSETSQSTHFDATSFPFGTGPCFRKASECTIPKTIDDNL
jgi:hypothetical protein